MFLGKNAIIGLHKKSLHNRRRYHQFAHKHGVLSKIKEALKSLFSLYTVRNITKNDSTEIIL